MVKNFFGEAGKLRIEVKDSELMNEQKNRRWRERRALDEEETGQECPIDTTGHVLSYHGSHQQ